MVYRAKQSILKRVTTILRIVGCSIVLNVLAFAGDGDLHRALLKLDEIAVAVTYSPGNGHLAITKIMMDRLRSEGFRGRFVLHVDPKMKDKLHVLFPGYDASGSDYQKLEKAKIETQPLRLPKHSKEAWSDYAEVHGEDPSKISRHPLIKKIGIAGGDDLVIPPQLMDVDAMIVIQPQNWQNPPEIRIRKTGTKFEYHAVQFDEVGDLPLRQTYRAPENPHQLIRDELKESPLFQKKENAVQAVVDQFGKREVFTAYGLSYGQGPRKLAVLLKGMEQARMKSPSTFRDGLVVPMISNFNEQEWSDFKECCKIMDLKLPQVYTVDEVRLSQKLRAMKSADVAIVKIGAVSQPMWNYLMMESTFPPTAAGQTGVDFLRSNGKPYMRTVFFGGGFPINGAQDAMNKLDVKWLADFFVGLRDSDSSFNRGYAKLASLANSEPDRITEVFSSIDQSDCLQRTLGMMVGKPSVTEVELGVIGKFINR